MKRERRRESHCQRGFSQLYPGSLVSPAKGHAAAESGERACAAAHVGAGGGQSLEARASDLQDVWKWMCFAFANNVYFL